CRETRGDFLGSGVLAGAWAGRRARVGSLHLPAAIPALLTPPLRDPLGEPEGALHVEPVPEFQTVSSEQFPRFVQDGVVAAEYMGGGVTGHSAEAEGVQSVLHVPRPVNRVRGGVLQQAEERQDGGPVAQTAEGLEFFTSIRVFDDGVENRGGAIEVAVLPPASHHGAQ